MDGRNSLISHCIVSILFCNLNISFKKYNQLIKTEQHFK